MNFYFLFETLPFPANGNDCAQRDDCWKRFRWQPNDQKAFQCKFIKNYVKNKMSAVLTVNEIRRQWVNFSQTWPNLSKQVYLGMQILSQGAAIDQWIHLRLPSCGPGFDPEAQNLHFFNLYLNCDEKMIKENKKYSQFVCQRQGEPCQWQATIYRHLGSQILPPKKVRLFSRKRSHKNVNFNIIFEKLSSAQRQRQRRRRQRQGSGS